MDTGKYALVSIKLIFPLLNKYALVTKSIVQCNKDKRFNKLLLRIRLRIIVLSLPETHHEIQVVHQKLPPTFPREIEFGNVVVIH